MAFNCFTITSFYCILRLIYGQCITSHINNIKCEIQYFNVQMKSRQNTRHMCVLMKKYLKSQIFTFVSSLIVLPLLLLLVDFIFGTNSFIFLLFAASKSFNWNKKKKTQLHLRIATAFVLLKRGRK